MYRDARVDEGYRSYVQGDEPTKQLLRRIVDRPRVRWFGAWIPPEEIRANVAQYVDNVQASEPDAIAQLAVFGLQPWEHEACTRLPSAAEQDEYRAWIDELAAGIGDRRALVVLQPDLPFAGCVPGGSTLPLRMIARAARVLNALPRTTVYLDAGAGDWAGAQEVARWLTVAGVRSVRGFALNLTHYHGTTEEIAYGRRVVELLARRGIRHKRFVVSTSSNGRPFSAQRARGTFARATPCRRRAQRRCVTLGIPPTTDVASPRCGLPPRTRVTAGRLVDGFLWIGRPWLVVRRNTFSLSRALRLASTTPF